MKRMIVVQKKFLGKQLRQRRDHDYVLSKRIVQRVPAGATIVFENLTNIHETSKIGRGKQNKNVDNKRELHRWMFAFVDYKAQERGIHIERIDPRHTSQTCSRCGHQVRNNCRSQGVFHCRSCCYGFNADLNAVYYNIRDTFCLAQGGAPSLSGTLVNQPLVSSFGLVTNLRLQAEVVNCDWCSYENSSKAEIKSA